MHTDLEGQERFGLVGDATGRYCKEGGRVSDVCEWFHADWARAYRNSGVWEETGKTGFQVEKCLRQRELSVHPHLEPQRLPQCRGGFTLCVARRLQGWGAGVSRRNLSGGDTAGHS